MSERSCNSKKRYPTEDLAKLVAIECWRERQVDLRIYPCLECGGYHLTSQNAEPVMKPGYREPLRPWHERKREDAEERRAPRRRWR